MAARKDVELVIRARDEATKAVQAIDAALQQFVSGQQKVVKGATAVDTTLTRLGTALAGVSKQLGGLTGATKVADSLDKASKAMQRGETESARLVAEEERLKQALAATTAAIANKNAELDQGANAVARQRAVVKAAQDEERVYAAEVTRVTAAQEKAASGETRIAATIAKKTAVVAQAGLAYEKLAQQLAKTAEPSARLVERVGQASASYEKQKAALASLIEKQQRFKDIQANVAATIGELQARLNNATEAFARETEALRRQEGSFAALTSDVRAAGQAESQFESALAQATTEIERNKVAVASSQAAMAQATAEITRAAQAQDRFATAARGQLHRALNEQTTDLLTLRRSYAETITAANNLGTEIGAAGVPTRKQAADFAILQASASRLRSEIELERQALASMREAFRSVGSDVGSAGVALENFKAIQAGLTAGLAKIAAEASASSVGLEREAAAGNAAAAAAVRMAQGANSQAGSLSKVDASAKATARSVTSMVDAQRTALSITERLKAQVFGLIATYAGFQGAIQLIKGAVDATVTLQAAENRLNVIANGNKRDVADQFDFLRRAADRLGISFGLLASEYSKFASSTIGTNIEGAKTQKIFIAVSEAARVLGLSVDDTEGVFKALGQIASKGTVQMEELRGQLGDRFPAALKLMADGLGVSIQQLQNMVKAGSVSSDALSGFADQINKRYGSSLQKALQTTQAEIGRFGNNFFQALAKIANGGLISAFDDLLKSLNTFFTSADGDEFFRKLGATIGVFINIVAVLTRHIGLVVDAFGLFAGIKLGAALYQSIIPAFTQLKNQLVALPGQMAAVRATAAATGVSLNSMAVAAKAAGVEMKAAFISTGIGALVVVATTLFTSWLTSVGDATKALNVHQKIVDSVKNSYDKLDGKTRDWVKHLNDANFAIISRNLDDLKKGLDDSLKQIAAFTSSLQAQKSPSGKGPFDADIDAVTALGNQLRDKKINVEQFSQSLDEVFKSTKSPNVKNAIVEISTALGGVKDQAKAVAVATVIYEDALHRVPLEEQKKHLQEVEDGYSGVRGATKGATEAANEFGNAVSGSGKKSEKALQDSIANANSLGGKIRTAADGFKGFVDSTKDTGDHINRSIKTVIDGVSTVETDAQRAARQLKELKTGPEDASKFVGKLKDDMGGVADAAGNVAEVFGQRFGGAIEVLGPAVDHLQEATVSVGAGFTEMGTQAQTALAQVDTSIQTATNSFQQSFNTGALQNFVTQATTAFQGAVAAVSDFQQQTGSLLGGFSQNTDAVFGGVVNDISTQFDALRSNVGSVIDGLTTKLHELRLAIIQAQQAGNLPGDQVPGNAAGGMIFGAGTKTSDSILRRLSRGEFVIRASAVDKYGADFFHRLNRMMVPSIPGLATGGPVTPVLASAVKSMSTGAKPMRPITVNIDSQPFMMMAPEETAQSLLTFSRKRQVRSAGRKPTWFGGTK